MEDGDAEVYDPRARERVNQLEFLNGTEWMKCSAENGSPSRFAEEHMHR